MGVRNLPESKCNTKYEIDLIVFEWGTMWLCFCNVNILTGRTGVTDTGTPGGVDIPNDNLVIFLSNLVPCDNLC